MRWGFGGRAASYSSCGQYRENVDAARATLKDAGLADVEIVYVADWHTHPGFVDANADHVCDAFSDLPSDVRGRARLVFTAHSIPVSMADRYPYRKQLEEPAAVARRVSGGSAALDAGVPVATAIRRSVTRTPRTLEGRNAQGLTAQCSRRLDFCAITSRCYTNPTSRRRRSVVKSVSMARAKAVNDHPRLPMRWRTRSGHDQRYAAGRPLTPGNIRMIRIVGALIVLAAYAPSASGQRSGAPNHTLTSVSGLKVGHHTLTARPTGCTVILAEAGAVAGVDVRGSAPGTRETDLLNPVNLVQQVHAIVLSGGSAFGLSAADGAVKYLDEKHVGFSTGAGVVPIVPAAILFDLQVGDGTIRPGPDCGYVAAHDANREPGGRRQRRGGGRDHRQVAIGSGMKGGPAARDRTAGRTRGRGAGRTTGGQRCGSRDGQFIAGGLTEDGADRRSARDVSESPGRGAGAAGSRPADAQTALENTTIGVVATNASLTKAQATKLAQMAHDGYARAIYPSHLTNDGDAIFALATGSRPGAPDMNQLGALAADAMADAIVRAVRAATGIPGYPAARDRVVDFGSSLQFAVFVSSGSGPPGRRQRFLCRRTTTGCRPDFLDVSRGQHRRKLHGGRHVPWIHRGPERLVVEWIGRNRIARPGLLGGAAHVARSHGARRPDPRRFSRAALRPRDAGTGRVAHLAGDAHHPGGTALGVAAVLNVAGGFSLISGCAIGALVTISYFTTGGLLSSAWVNLMQLIVILVGFAVAVPFAVNGAGGWPAMTATAGSSASIWTSTGPASGWRLLFLLGPAFVVSPGLLQKAYGAGDEAAVRRGVAWNGIGLLIFAWAPAHRSGGTGISISRPDLALPTVLASMLPPSLGVVALAAVFSAEVSSADAVLFMLATSASRDLYRGFVKRDATEAELLRVARIAAVVGGVCGLGVALVYGSVRAAVSVFYAILTVTLVVPVVGGLYVGTPAGAGLVSTWRACRRWS
jgi:L-aminopeptidase/D-esterase-like protein